MEIKLKENSILTVKNHSGTTLCSIDEATGVVTGVGTKLYRHSFGFRYDDEPFKDIEFDITSTTSTPATNLNTAINVLENAISTVFNGTEEGVGLDIMGYFYVSNDIIINYIKTDPGAFPFESVVVDNDTYWTIADTVTEL